MSEGETPKHIAERTVREWVEHGLDEHYEPGAEFVITMPPDDLIERVESLLNAECERAAKIAETEAGTRCMMHQKTGKGVCGYEIAALIRGK